MQQQNQQKQGERTSLARHYYAADLEAGVNKQINIELYGSYVYLSMAYYFDRDDVALHGMSNWFRKKADKEHEHALKLMKYQNTRGGRIVLQNVEKPERDEWGTGLEAFEASLALEKANNQALLELHKIAAQNNDGQMCDFLQDDYLRDQVKSIEEIAKYITNLKRTGTGIGEFIFDREVFGKN